MLTLDDIDATAWPAGAEDQASGHPAHARWMRARALGAPLRIGNAAGPLGRSALARRRERVSPLLARATHLLAKAIGELNERGFAVALADQDGFILRCWGSTSFEERRTRAGFAEGTCWNEASRGTNAIGTALAERTSVAVLGRAHYAADVQGLACYAALIRDPISSSVGVLDITGPFTGADPLLGVLVESLATSVESSLFAEAERQTYVGAFGPSRVSIAQALSHLHGVVLGEHGSASAWDEIGKVAVDTLADWCLIDLAKDGGYVRQHVATTRPGKRLVVEALYRYPLDARRRNPALTALGAGRTVVLQSPSLELFEATAHDAEHARILAEMEPASVMAVPMFGTAGPLGSLTLISSLPGLQYGAAEVDFAEMLAAYAALACENAQRMRSLRQTLSLRDDVLAMVAHDLRSPLGAIALSASALERRLVGRTREHGMYDRSVQAIARSTERMSRMLDDLLDVGRAETGRLSLTPQRCSAATLVSAASDIAGTAAPRLRLLTECEPDVPDVLADRDRTLQVFANLVGNAAKFTPEGGQLMLGCAREGGGVRFWVRDSGPGIRREHLDKLFERGWQAEPADRRGAGLGLYICKALVEAQGGAIGAESEFGKGATFHFTLKVA